MGKTHQDDGNRRRKDFWFLGTWGCNPCRSHRKVGTLSVDGRGYRYLGKEVPLLSWKAARRRVGCWIRRTTLWYLQSKALNGSLLARETKQLSSRLYRSGQGGALTYEAGIVYRKSAHVWHHCILQDSNIKHVFLPQVGRTSKCSSKNKCTRARMKTHQLRELRPNRPKCSWWLGITGQLLNLLQLHVRAVSDKVLLELDFAISQYPSLTRWRPRSCDRIIFNSIVPCRCRHSEPATGVTIWTKIYITNWQLFDNYRVHSPRPESHAPSPYSCRESVLSLPSSMTFKFSMPYLP